MCIRDRLQHFKNYLEGEKVEQLASPDDLNKGSSLVYLKKWMKTKHAIMFRLSNKIVQVNFTDRTEVILSSELKMLTYVNKKGERSNYPLATALELSLIHISEPTRQAEISYAVFCLKKKKNKKTTC
eukprot:TRINITY_DN4350_c0_g1_i6.p2 TRINITY_DN4350_c0_g1~~TRINITY_DN4350_c0_g1_i6.p2  ORF type:complete len:127 (+),score=20.32 TRINITY_DN4350_c0_g1_i6:160-540(+)